jgi:26S proteasome regulatory subunit N8
MDAFQVKTNDMMLVIYVASLIRSVTALHDLINNKLELASYESGEKKDKDKEKEKDGEKKDGDKKEGKDEKDKKGDKESEKKEEESKSKK